MSIQGPRLFLRALEKADLPCLHKWQNDPNVTRQLADWHVPSSLYQQEKWYERVQEDRDTIRWAIVLNEGPVIGYSGLWNVHWRDRWAEHGILIGEPEHRSQGYGRETIWACVRYAFEEMGFRKIEATILETNAPSLKAYQACGFQLEGVLRQRALRQGVWVNAMVFGLLAAEANRTREVDTRAGHTPATELARKAGARARPSPSRRSQQKATR